MYMYVCVCVCVCVCVYGAGGRIFSLFFNSPGVMFFQFFWPPQVSSTPTAGAGGRGGGLLLPLQPRSTSSARGTLPSASLQAAGTLATHMHTHTPTHTPTHPHPHPPTHPHAQTHSHTYIHTSTHTSTHTHIQARQRRKSALVLIATAPRLQECLGLGGGQWRFDRLERP